MIRVSADAFDIMAELEACRAAPDPRERIFTHEQDVFMWKARGPDVSKKVPYTVICRLWDQKWGDAPNVGTMRKRLDAMEKQGGPKKER